MLFQTMEPGLPKTANEHTLRVEAATGLALRGNPPVRDIPFALSGFQAWRDANVAVPRFA
jgi:hypothetical protein